MKRILMGGCLVALCVIDARAQSISRSQKKEDVFVTPTLVLSERMRRNYTEQEAGDYFWQVREDTMPSERRIIKDVEISETTPWVSARSLWASETMVQRSAERGAGKLSKLATEEAVLEDHIRATRMAEANYPGKQENDAILEAVYRHFFQYRARGFGKDTTVYFLGLGPHKADAPPSVLAAMESDPTVKKDGVKIRPISRTLEVTDDAIRDLDTGAYGAVFRVDDMSPMDENGEVKVTGTFGERDGFFFTQQFTLRNEKDGWKVVKETDLPTQG